MNAHLEKKTQSLVMLINIHYILELAKIISLYAQ